MDITNVSFIDDLIYKHLHQSYLNDVHHQFQVIQQLPNINKIKSIKQKNGIIKFIINLSSLGINVHISDRDVIHLYHKFLILFELPNSMYGVDVEQQNLIMKHHKYIQHMFKKLNIQHHMMSDDVGIILEHYVSDSETDYDYETDYDTDNDSD